MSKKMSRRPPRIERRGDCHQLIVDGEPLILLAAEAQNSSPSSLEYMERHGCWERVKGYNCNALLVPVYWELVEPEEGRFDFSLVDGIIDASRRHGLRLVLLWFGTWKNSRSSYAPAYVKTDLERFQRCRLADGLTSRTVSPLSQAACQADSRAFAHLMQHVREVDAAQQTVLMVQVENEIGLLGADRDFSPAAEEHFNGPVPDDLVGHLRDHWDEIHGSLRERLDRAALERGGSWFDVFGTLAGETFMAWHFARYVEHVVRAGKDAYDLPMFVNTWLDYDSAPGAFPMGGPVARMLDVWHVAAPSLDAFAPDIYYPDFARACADFMRPFNPLIIPESLATPAAEQAFWAVAQCKALCFSPFGLDHPHCWLHIPWQSEGLAETYALLREMMPMVTAAQAEDRIRGVVQDAGAKTSLRLGDYELTVRTTCKGTDGRPAAAGLILQLGEDEFVVAGRGFSVGFELAGARGDNVDFLWAEQGGFREGQWIAERRLNGDDTWDSSLRLMQGPELSARRGRLYRYE